MQAGSVETSGGVRGSAPCLEAPVALAVGREASFLHRYLTVGALRVRMPGVGLITSTAAEQGASAPWHTSLGVFAALTLTGCQDAGESIPSPLLF